MISTLPDERSGWLRSNLIERVRHATSAHGRARGRRPAGHHDRGAGRASEEHRWRQPASPTRPLHGEHHGPPAANRSSRVEPQLLGMLLFIISEVMVFGAFFTAYFFIRIAQGEPWPAPGHAPAG